MNWYRPIVSKTREKKQNKITWPFLFFEKKKSGPGPFETIQPRGSWPVNIACRRQRRMRTRGGDELAPIKEEEMSFLIRTRCSAVQCSASLPEGWPAWGALHACVHWRLRAATRVRVTDDRQAAVCFGSEQIGVCVRS